MQLELDAKLMGVVAAYGMYHECCDGELEPHWANKSGLKVSTGPHLEPLMARRPILTSTACHSSSEMASSFDSVDCRIRRSCFLRSFSFARSELSRMVDGCGNCFPLRWMDERKVPRAAARSDVLADIGSFVVARYGRVRRRTPTTDACGAFALIPSPQVGPGTNKLEGGRRRYRGRCVPIC